MEKIRASKRGAMRAAARRSKAWRRMQEHRQPKGDGDCRKSTNVHSAASQCQGARVWRKWCSDGAGSADAAREWAKQKTTSVCKLI